MGALLLLLCLAQDQPPQPFKDWKVQRREPNPKSGALEIVALLEGDVAVPLNMTRGKELFDITGLRVTYFTDPRTPGERSMEVRLRSDKARVDNDRDRVDLAGRVRVERDEGNGALTVIEAPEAVLHFRKRFVCPAHEPRQPQAGKCPACGTELKPRTFTTIEAPKTFEMTKSDPATHLTGEGLTASDDVRTMRVERDGFLVTTGSPKELAAPTPSAVPSKPSLTEMRSKGPMTFVETDAGITVTCEKDVRIRRAEATPDGPATTTVEADAAELLGRRSPGPGRRPEPQRVTARGHIRMTGPEGTAAAETLVWDHADHADFVVDVAVLTGSPVHVVNGPNTIDCRTLRIERLEGVSTFKDDVSARLTPGRGPDAKPVALASRMLVTRQAPGARDLSEIEATGDVVLQGFGSGSEEKPGRAEADRFYWNQAEDHGFLERRPTVRILQEESVLYAPRVVLEGRSMIVLKGPKQIVLTQKDSEGKPVRTTVSSDGDIVLDSSTGRTTIRLQDTCSVRNPDVHLSADRMTVTTTKEGAVEALRAWGRVRARQVKEGATLFGERMTYAPEKQTMTLTGSPIAVAETGRTVATQEQIIVTDRDGVKYQEMRGGKRGVKIIVDERVK